MNEIKIKTKSCEHCKRAFQYVENAIIRRFCASRCRAAYGAKKARAQVDAIKKPCRECGKDFKCGQSNKWYCPDCQEKKKLVLRYPCWNCLLPGWKEIHLVKVEGYTCTRCRAFYRNRVELEESRLDMGMSSNTPEAARVRLTPIYVKPRTTWVKK